MHPKTLIFIFQLFFISNLCRADVLLEWRLHDDDHIVDSHKSGTNWIRATPPFSIHQTVTIPSDVSDGVTAFTRGLRKAFSEISKPGEELFIYMSSHGAQGKVCHQNRLISLSKLADRIKDEILAHEAKSGPIRVNIVYSACYSGSLAQELDRNFGNARQIQSAVTAIMSAPDDEVSHSGILGKYLREGTDALNKVDQAKATFCEGCTSFERLAKIVSGYNYDAMDRPTTWSSNPKVTQWTLREGLSVASASNYRSSFNFEHAMISNEHLVDKNLRSKEVFKAFEDAKFKPGSLSEYLLANFPKTASENWLWVEKLEEMKTTEQKLKFLKMVLSQGGKESLLAASALGWVSKEGPGSPLLTEIISHLKARGSELENQEELRRLWAHSIYTKTRFDLDLQSGNLRSALQELQILEDIPVGYRHSASPLHFAPIAASKKISEWLKPELARNTPKAKEFLDEMVLLEGPGKRELYLHLMEGRLRDLGKDPRLLDEYIRMDLGSSVLEYRAASPSDVQSSVERLKKSGALSETQYRQLVEELKRKGVVFPSLPAKQPPIAVQATESCKPSGFPEFLSRMLKGSVK